MTPRRRLGQTDMEISSVGLGSWAIGGPWAFGWGPQDDEASIRAIQEGVERGINWVDTAPVYGHGHAEEVVGRAIRALPADRRPLVFTKCGMVWGGNADPSARSVRNLSPDSIRREVEDSLRRLGVERIDLYQFHWPDQTGVPVEESWATMGNLVQEGKIRAAGVSNFSVDLLERAEAVRHVDSLQPPFSLITRSTASDLLPWARKHGTGVIAYAPMQNGLLTGAFSSSRVADLADDDWRKRDPQFTEPQLSQNLALVESLRAIAERHQSSLPAVAIAWALAWRGVTGAIAGARSPEQLRGWIGAMELELSMADLDEIGIAIAHTGAGNGPVRPELDA